MLKALQSLLQRQPRLEKGAQSFLSSHFAEAGNCRHVTHSVILVCTTSLLVHIARGESLIGNNTNEMTQWP